MNDRQQKTYDTIMARCTDLIPPVDIATHIKPGTLRVANNTLDGITFEAVDPADLETGNAAAGRAYFGANCSSCHSATGDLAGIGTRLLGLNLMRRMLYPGGQPGSAHGQILPRLFLQLGDLRGDVVTAEPGIALDPLERP